MSEVDYTYNKSNPDRWELRSSKVNDVFAYIRYNNINKSVTLENRGGYPYHSLESVRFTYFTMKEMLEEKMN